MIILGQDVSMKGATLIICFWLLLLLIILVLMLRSWLGRDKLEDYNNIRWPPALADYPDYPDQPADHTD